MHLFDYTNSKLLRLNSLLGEALFLIEKLKNNLAPLCEITSSTISHLSESATIQSIKASNRIEGIFTSDERLTQIVKQNATPKHRSEEEIAGYRDVLYTINENFDEIKIKLPFILQLHRDLYAFSAQTSGGFLKKTDNNIVETNEFGQKQIRFAPVPAYLTEDAMKNMCDAYEIAQNESQLHPILLASAFVLDFLCIHPFLDGNGRMSRLLSHLILRQNGFHIGAFISLEHCIERTKDSYYECLHKSSQQWHENNSDYEHFARYFVGIILRAYRHLENQLENKGNCSD